MWKRIGYFALGVISAPIVIAVTRTAVRGLIKGTMVIGEYVGELAAEVREDVQDLAAETRASDAEPGGTTPSES